LTGMGFVDFPRSLLRPREREGWRALTLFGR